MTPEDQALLSPVFSDSCEVYGTYQQENKDDVRKVNGIIVASANALGKPESVSIRLEQDHFTGGGTSSGAGSDEALGPDCYTGISSVFAWIICPTLGVVGQFCGVGRAHNHWVSRCGFG